jgi:hypothetical protein
MYSVFVEAVDVVVPCVLACDDSTECAKETPRLAPKNEIPAFTVVVSEVPWVSVDETSIVAWSRIAIGHPPAGPPVQWLLSDTWTAVVRR